MTSKAWSKKVTKKVADWITHSKVLSCHVNGLITLKSASSMLCYAKSLQSCLTLCDPIDGSPPGSHPWDSPGKNTGVGCHFLLQCMKVKRESEVAQSCPTLCDPIDGSPPGSSVHGILKARVLEQHPLRGPKWANVRLSHGVTLRLQEERERDGHQSPNSWLVPHGSSSGCCLISDTWGTWARISPAKIPNP